MGDVGLSYIPLLLNLKELDISLGSKTTLAGVRIMMESFHNLQILHIDISCHIIFTDDILRLIGVYCCNLREFKHEGGEQPSNESILAVIQGCPLLEMIYIRLAYSTQYDDTILYAIAQSCPCMQYVYIGFNSQSYTDQGMIALSRGCPELRDLDCSKLTAITDTCILSFAEYCHKLKRIGMNELTNLTSHALCILLKASPHLTSLLLRDTDQLDDECLLGIAQYCHKLTSFILGDSMRLTQSTLTLLITESGTTLERLFIDNCNITDEFTEVIVNHCKRLEETGFEGCPYITGQSLATLLSQGKCLVSIRIDQCGLNRRNDKLRLFYTGKSQAYCTRATRLKQWVPYYNEDQVSSDESSNSDEDQVSSDESSNSDEDQHSSDEDQVSSDEDQVSSDESSNSDDDEGQLSSDDDEGQVSSDDDEGQVSSDDDDEDQGSSDDDEGQLSSDDDEGQVSSDDDEGQLGSEDGEDQVSSDDDEDQVSSDDDEDQVSSDDDEDQVSSDDDEDQVSSNDGEDQVSSDDDSSICSTTS